MNIQIGDKIRGYDFEPMAGRETRYAEGEVFALDDEHFGKGYWIKVEVDTCFPDMPRPEVFIPAHVWFCLEYDGRVIKIEGKQND